VWPQAEPIETARLLLAPLRAEDANEMSVLLDDVSLHEFTGGRPATADQLRTRYGAGDRGWLNWVVRLRAGGEAVGTVQATLAREEGRLCATLAWVIAGGHQGNGYAREAAAAMAAWLRRHGTEVLVAHVHPGHEASIAVARHLGLMPGDAGEDGEIRWHLSRRTASA
jgi:RimJ/RimL family protein N-acetyltransferase